MLKFLGDSIIWLSDIVKKQRTAQVAYVDEYPVHIGWNGCVYDGYIINKQFHDLEKYFGTIYWDTVLTNQPNVIVYVFRAYEPTVMDMRKTRFLQLVQKSCEKALTNFFRENGIFTPTDNFIAVHYLNGMLRIAIARNNSGFKEIEKLRKFENK